MHEAWSLSLCLSSFCCLPEMGCHCPLPCFFLGSQVLLGLPTLSPPHDCCHCLSLERALARYWKDWGWRHTPFLCHTSSSMAHQPLVHPYPGTQCVLWHRGSKILGSKPSVMNWRQSVDRENNWLNPPFDQGLLWKFHFDRRESRGAGLALAQKASLCQEVGKARKGRRIFSLPSFIKILFIYF